MKKLVIVLAVLLGFLIAADRLGAYVAGRVAADVIAQKAPFATQPSVTVHGIPFLTQAVGGDYRDVEIQGRALQLQRIEGASLDVHLRGARVALGDLIGRRVTSLPCDSVDGTVTVPFSSLGALAGISGLSLTKRGDSLVAGATLPAGGQSVPVTGAARVVVEGGRLRLAVDSVDTGGLPLPAAVRQELAKALNVPIDLPALPYGLRIDGVNTTGDALEVHASGVGITLGR